MKTKNQLKPKMKQAKKNQLIMIKIQKNQKRKDQHLRKIQEQNLTEEESNELYDLDDEEDENNTSTTEDVTKMYNDIEKEETTKKEKKEVEKPENDETSEEETVEMELPDLDEIKQI